MLRRVCRSTTHTDLPLLMSSDVRHTTPPKMQLAVIKERRLVAQTEVISVDSISISSRNGTRPNGKSSELLE